MAALNTKTLRLEPLGEAHIARIVEIEKEANGAPWSERSFRNELENAQSIFRVAILNGQVQGYGGLWTVADEAHITTVAVAQQARRNGIGKKLMIELLERAKEAGMTCATLEVRAGNEAAIALYEVIGFERVAVRRKYYPDNKEDAVIMWLYNLQSWTSPQ